MDYWDRLGWKDPFGSKDYSERQRQYRKVKQLKTMGTPQFFVDNEALPSVRGAYQRIPGLVGDAAKQAPRLRIEATPVVDGKKISVAVKLHRVDGKAKLGKSVVIVPLLWQRKAVTQCSAGENKGKTLTEYHVVRAMGKPLSVNKALDRGVMAKFEVPKGVQPKDLGVALLIEDREKMRTLECVSLPLAK